MADERLAIDRLMEERNASMEDMQAVAEECARIADLVAAKWALHHNVAPAAAHEVAKIVREQFRLGGKP